MQQMEHLSSPASSRSKLHAGKLIARHISHPWYAIYYELNVYPHIYKKSAIHIELRDAYMLEFGGR